MKIKQCLVGGDCENRELIGRLMVELAAARAANTILQQQLERSFQQFNDLHKINLRLLDDATRRIFPKD